ncbi:MAG TPA: helix-turn-helix domain-containing protein [Candidatus Elarobacter sp.]|nr:helix-turn-helix domain-containing protein [Candidatus Elarobacter sp.]
MNESEQPKDSPRQRKRRETFARITETGLRLFLTDGYEATTLDAIAAAAGISRRNFFYYFKSKEEILLAFQSGSSDAFRDALLKQSPRQRPLDAVHNALVKVVSRFASDEFLAIDRLMRSTETLRTRKSAVYERQEEALFSALCELWHEPRRRAALRLVAMASIGALRLAIEAWHADGGQRPIATYLNKSFAALKAEI